MGSTIAFGNQMPRTGDAYMGFYCYSKLGPNERDFIQAELNATFSVGVRYLVTFYVNCANNYRYAVGKIGAYFSIEQITRPDMLRFDVIPNLESHEGPITDTSNWVLISDTIESKHGGERFLTIGNFRIDGNSDTLHFNTSAPFGNQGAYYYIDDVSVIALDSVSSVAEATPQRMAVWPNPANGAVNLSTDRPFDPKAVVILIDAQGREVQRHTLNGGDRQTTIAIKGLPSGIYGLFVSDAHGRHPAQRVVILRP